MEQNIKSIESNTFLLEYNINNIKQNVNYIENNQYDKWTINRIVDNLNTIRNNQDTIKRAHNDLADYVECIASGNKLFCTGSIRKLY